MPLPSLIEEYINFVNVPDLQTQQLKATKLAAIKK
jgi:hypothetical protein